MVSDIEVQIALQSIEYWKKCVEESERNQSQNIVCSDSGFDSDSDQGWQKVKKARRKTKTSGQILKKLSRHEAAGTQALYSSLDASFYIFCTPPVGKGLVDQPNIGDASGTLGSVVLPGYNLPPKAGGTSGTSNSSIPDSDSDDRSIHPDPLNPASLVNQWLDLPLICLNPDEPVYPNRVPLYERKSTLLNPRQEEPSHHEPLVIII